jgi:hypothetical protein
MIRASSRSLIQLLQRNAEAHTGYRSMRSLVLVARLDIRFSRGVNLLNYAICIFVDAAAWNLAGEKL